MAKYMLLSGKHVDQATRQSFTVEKGAAPVAVESADPLDKMFPGKFIRAAVAERGRQAIEKAQKQAQKDEDPAQQAVGLKEGRFISAEAADLIEAAKAGEAVDQERRNKALENKKGPEAAKAVEKVEEQIEEEDGVGDGPEPAEEEDSARTPRKTRTVRTTRKPRTTKKR
jgi:hypothetical protein